MSLITATLLLLSGCPGTEVLIADKLSYFEVNFVFIASSLYKTYIFLCPTLRQREWIIFCLMREPVDQSILSLW